MDDEHKQYQELFNNSLYC